MSKPLYPGRTWLALLVLSLLSCSRPATPRERLDPQLAARALKTYADIALASYGDALAGARALGEAVDELLASPTDASLTAARNAWLAARRPYLQTEVFRFYDGPIDRVEMLVNTWPIDESYVEGGATNGQGIVEDAARYPSIEQDLLVSLNARDGETSISTGYHVIEFLLWGADLQQDGPGARPLADFVQTGDDPRPARRRLYLKAAVALLVLHLSEVHDAWRADSQDSYRARFLALPVLDALGLALRGMGSLSGPELAGERLTVGYETKDQENEQSCFSDSTTEDVIYDVLGIENVCLGRYRSTAGNAVSGPGVCTLLSSVDAALGSSLSSQIAASLQAARRIPAPFDQALLGNDSAPGRQAIKRTIGLLEAQTTTLARAASLLGLGATIVQVKP